MKRLILRVIIAFALLYVRHVGVTFTAARIVFGIARRLKKAPWWAGLLAAIAAWKIRWILPALLLGKFKSFGSLDAADKQRLLDKLQNSGSLLMRIAFLPLKTFIVLTCFSSKGEDLRGRL
ncbi:MAG: hypothetical protein AABZ44_07835 [Elusimicrobiota bacterium]